MISAWARLVSLSNLFHRSLTSGALVAKSKSSAQAENRDIAHVPASVDGHTSFDVSRADDKHTPRSTGTMDSEEDLNKVDTTAPKGVQDVQAMTYVWSKRDLIAAYVMFVSLLQVCCYRD
jgi:hypothetical protein